MAWPPPLTPRRFRPFRPEESPVITAYWQRCDELARTLPPRDNDALKTLELEGKAAKSLGRFMEECEWRARRGDLKEVAPFALRGAELAARIAGVQATFSGADIVDANDIERAIGLVRYSLQNWLYVLNGKQTDDSTGLAMILYQWLLKQGKPIKASEILQAGPTRLRSKDRRDAALERLAEVGLVAIKDGVVQLVAASPHCESCE